MTTEKEKIEELKTTTSDFGRSAYDIGKEILANEKLTDKQKIIIIVLLMLVFSVGSATFALILYKF